MKYLFFLLLSFTSYSLHSMLTHLQKIYPTKIASTYQQIVPYHQQRDKNAIISLALKNQTRLSSYSPDNPIQKKWFLQEMESALHSSNTQCKVCLVDNKPIGFITYTIYYPWYRKKFPTILGPNVHIHHLAIEDQYQNKGYGSALLQKVIADCKEQKVYKIMLTTTSWSLDRYYHKYGFIAYRSNKWGPEQYWRCVLHKPSFTEIRKETAELLKAVLPKWKE
jgi:GNAT superfamily N-acetyltransferase